jgi:hypothetical protein
MMAWHLSLSPPVGLGDLPAQLIIVGEVDVIEVESV